MRIPLLIAAAPAALALAACAQTSDTDAMGADTTATATETAAAPAADAAMTGDVAATPQAFVNAAAASDMFEIESAKLAQSKASSDEVKKFADMMVRDHTKSTADLKAAVADADGVTLAPEMTAKQQSDLTALRGATSNFDAIYKQQQTAAHEEALAMLRAQADGGTVPSLKAFAAKTAPVVEQHLEHVKRLP